MVNKGNQIKERYILSKSPNETCNGYTRCNSLNEKLRESIERQKERENL